MLEARDEGAAAKAEYERAARAGHAEGMFRLAKLAQRARDWPGATRWLRRAAERGHAVAMCDLGFCHEKGLRIEQDVETAFNWYLRAAELGDVAAMAKVGAFYEKGRTVTLDTATAALWYGRAAEQGNPKALCRLGALLAEGAHGVARDSRRALECFTRAAEQEPAYIPAFFALGECYANGIGIARTMSKAADWYRRAAGKDHVGAKVALARCHEVGDGVEQDAAKAFALYSSAAESESAEGWYHVGRCHEEGLGTAVDGFKAVEWYRKASLEGDYAAAHYALARTHEAGQVVPEDLELACLLYRQAADSEIVDAQYALALCYLGGRGVQHDPIESVGLLNRAASAGHVEAMVQLALCHRNGVGVLSDDQAAVGWLRNAVDAGSSRAQFLLGSWIDEGLLLPRDADEALRLQMAAAEAGVAEASYNVAMYFLEGGDAVERDVSAAYRHALIAAEKGLDVAQVLVAHILETGMHGSFPSDDDARPWYERAAEQEHPFAIFKLGVLASHDGDATAAVARFEQATEFDQPDAHAALGVCYETGQGIGQDLPSAIKSYAAAAARGHVEGCYQFGRMIKNHDSAAQDLPLEAYIAGETKIMRSEADLFRFAAERGHGDAAAELGICYDHGERGVECDAKMAFHWYNRAAGTGSSHGQCLAGVCYMHGRGVEQSTLMAARWFRAASEQGHVEASLNLGCCYLNGSGFEAQPVKAFEAFHKAAALDHSSGMLNLGYCYEYGIGTKKDEEKAFRWYNEAAQLGNAIAQGNVGAMYARQAGVGHLSKTWGRTKFWTRAMLWYRKAADAGHADAQLSLALCYAKGETVRASWPTCAKFLFLASKAGHVAARFCLGCLFDLGLGVEADPKQAAKLWTETAATYTSAKRYLARCYSLGRGVPRSHVEAVRWAAMAEQEGDAEAAFWLGCWYMGGLGVVRATDRGLEMLKKAASAGHAPAQAMLGGVLERGLAGAVDLPNGLHWYGGAAEQGHALACVRLASLHSRGRGVPLQEAAAGGLLKRAADGGSLSASFVLAMCMQRGRGVPRAAQAAFTLLKDLVPRATMDQGRRPSMCASRLVCFALGLCYETGDGCASDLAAAEVYYRRAFDIQGWPAKGADPSELARLALLHADRARDDDSGSMLALALCYQRGEGVAREAREATAWLERAAALEHAAAEALLGICYQRGNGCAMDAFRAVDCFRNAAANGDCVAMYCLALALEQGMGIAASHSDAIGWLYSAAEAAETGARFVALAKAGFLLPRSTQAELSEFRETYFAVAEAGDSSAQFNIGLCYEGEFDGDWCQAKKWYARAAEQKHASALCKLAWLHYHGLGVPQDEHRALMFAGLAHESCHPLGSDLPAMWAQPPFQMGGWPLHKRA